MSCKISVIIPTYNSAKFISQCLLSVIEQDVSGVETIVVDDGSTDGSGEIAEEFGREVKVIRQTNQGACVARNVGIAAAAGAFVKFLDADDYLLPGALQAQLEHASALPDNQFSYGRMFRHFENDGRLLPHSLRDGKQNNQDSLDRLLMDPPVTASLLYPRRLLDALGGFDPRLVKRQDFDMFARALYLGTIPVACGAPIYAYRDHDGPDRVSKRISADAFESQIQMFRRHQALLRDTVNSVGSHSLEIGLAKTIWITARNCLRAGYEPAAVDLFSLAQEVGGGHARSGKPLYIYLSWLVGPVAAERVLENLKPLRVK